MNMRGNGSAGTRAVRNRDIDIALVRRATGGSGYRAVPLRHDHFVAVLPRGHRHATDLDDDPFDLDALATEPWVWIPRDISPGYHDDVVAACRRAGFSPDARHQANSMATQLAMVSCASLAAGRGRCRNPRAAGCRTTRRAVDAGPRGPARRALLTTVSQAVPTAAPNSSG